MLVIVALLRFTKCQLGLGLNRAYLAVGGGRG